MSVSSGSVAIDLRRLLQTAIERSGILIGVVILCMISGGIEVSKIQPRYTAVATLRVVANSSDSAEGIIEGRTTPRYINPLEM